ncbi:glycosyltransferase, partial [uncultured Bilophila sp.]|uniref:glycosyltransferase n=1 Tax=uncultured Bilophila sp. TaxID=529385 RepID=UPI002620D362
WGAPEPARGGVPLETVRQWEKEGLVDYLGVTRDVRPYVAQATAVVLPSWREGLPCSLMEAMSMGRAIVATDVPGCRDVVSDGRNGFLVPSRSPEALARALSALIDDPALARRMGAEGRSIAETELDARKAADLILRVMNLIA